VLRLRLSDENRYAMVRVPSKGRNQTWGTKENYISLSINWN
jgi:hypothetical protein